MGGRLHGAGHRNRQLLPGFVAGLRESVHARQSNQCADRYSHLADDHAHDDEGGFLGREECGTPARGLFVTLLVNWTRQAFFHGAAGLDLFSRIVSRLHHPAEADQYIAGCIILAAAPCTAMYSCGVISPEHPAYTLLQARSTTHHAPVFVPIVQFLVRGASTSPCRSAFC